MAKPKAPLLSLGAHGSVGDAITYQRRKTEHIARAKPFPAYRYTLPQAYQRWLYQDYRELWLLQSEATRQIYTSLGSHFHLTGYQYWMRESLRNLTNIVGYWKLDEIAGVVAHDSSRQENNGTIIGASFATGVIGGCLYFDGIDDYVDCGDPPELGFTSAFSVEAIFKQEDIAGVRMIVCKWHDINQRAFRFMSINGKLYFVLYDEDGVGDNQIGRYYNIALPANTWYHVCATWDGTVVDNTGLRIYVNGVRVDNADNNAGAFAGLRDVAAPVRIGLQHDLQHDFKGWIDHVLLHDRELSAAEALRHADRRHPV